MTSAHHMHHEAGRHQRQASVFGRWRAGLALAVAGAAALASAAASGATALADAPVFSRSAILGNVALALSVEYPTVERAAYPNQTDYSSGTTYKGYFDHNKCYSYQYAAAEANRYFYPAGLATNRTCVGANDAKWSGNFLNWATTQTIDPFRLVMTGGYRVVDTITETRLQKAWHSGQDANLFKNKNLAASGTVAGATPFAWSRFRTRINGAGFQMLFTGNSTDNLDSFTTTSATAYDPAVAMVANSTYAISIRVKVCDPSAAAGGVESNCKQYGSNWKPEGLMQQYSQRLRFSAFGYLNQSGNDRDGAVMRARMKFVGPTYPVPGVPDVTNAAKEWYPDTGIFNPNPDTTDADATNSAYAVGTPVNSSGVANYLNKFGQLLPANGYKSNDPVGELYYAAQRYFRNLGAVPEWNTLRTSTTVDKALDGFPVVRTWDDPIQYSCQKNFILGIGDVYTHADKHVPGYTNNASEVVAMPDSVSGDAAVNAVTATNLVGVLQGMGTTLGTDATLAGCCSDNRNGMAGLAYWANVNDIRPDVAGVKKTQGMQTIQSLWVDVLEAPFVTNNQFYLTAKYGGFVPPSTLTTPYSFSNTTALPDSWWWTTGEYVTGTVKRPDNYYTAGNPDQMISGLTQAFRRINSLSSAFTTSFSTSQPQVSPLSTASFGAQYDANNWTGELIASEVVFDSKGNPTKVERWRATAKLSSQLAGAGWDSARRVVTWNGAGGIPFRHGSLTTAQQTALDTSYRAAVDDSADYLNYLRGDRTHEAASTAAGSSHAYRTRELLLGDIVGSPARPVGPPSLPLKDGPNPGYEEFRTTYKNRPTVVYAGANDGMLHAFNGSLTGAAAGQEIFAYVPRATFAGPSSPSTPEVNGLASLGSPNFEHHFLVNGVASNHDVDFTKTWDGSAVGTGTANWHSILIGGLGKGGRSYYALDITNPAAVTTETAAAANVLWEFTAPQMGFTFGEAVVVKTRKYGWTVILPSGYNTPDGRGYLFFVHPRTGALLETVSTGTGSVGNDAGLAHVNAYVLDYKDGYADAVYGGDLLGNLWRFDITGTSGAYPSPLKFAQLTDSVGNPQPVTSRPVIEWHPKYKIRVVMVGTGRLLDASDRNSSLEQSFYAIKDGNAVRFNRASDLPAGITFPIGRAQLVRNDTLMAAIEPTTASPMGWYVDLGLGADNVAWRLITDPVPFAGIVAIAPTLPTVDDPCLPSGQSRIYGADFSTGETAVINEAGIGVSYAPIDVGVITDLRFLSVGGKPRLVYGTDTGVVRNQAGNFSSALGLRRLNWREVGLGN